MKIQAANLSDLVPAISMIKKARTLSYWEVEIEFKYFHFEILAVYKVCCAFLYSSKFAQWLQAQWIAYQLGKN